VASTRIKDVELAATMPLMLLVTEPLLMVRSSIRSEIHGDLVGVRKGILEWPEMLAGIKVSAVSCLCHVTLNLLHLCDLG